MNEHTPEPWNKFVTTGGPTMAGGQVFINDKNGEAFVSFVGNNNDGTNARRIVACVNALSGIPTKDIEQGQVLHNIGGLYKERDDLLAALKKAHEKLCEWGALVPKHLDPDNKLIRDVIEITNAIAKAESC